MLKKNLGTLVRKPMLSQIAYGGLVVHTYKISIRGSEAGGSQIKGQTGLNNETLSQNKTEIHVLESNPTGTEIA